MAGNTTVAYALETSYNSGVGSSPTYYLPGSNVTVEDLTLQNFLTRVRNPGSVLADRSVARQLEGALSVSFNLSTVDFNDLIFADTDGSGNQILGSGHVPSAEWYFGLDYADSPSSISTVERQVKGWAPTEVRWQYTTPELVRVTMTGPYATETKNTSITPGTITGGDVETDFHEASFTIASSTPFSASLNTAELSLTNLAAFSRGPQGREPLDARRLAPEIELTLNAEIRTADTLSRAYDGTTSATSPGTSLSSVSGTIAFSPEGTTASSYDLGKLTTNEYSWEELVSGDTLANEGVTFAVTGSFKQTV